ncbi:MAG: hypothetical protein FWE13_02445 [Firmicutes bacterium]|nr:hypothetical protein [Bacillota bacterium]
MNNKKLKKRILVTVLALTLVAVMMFLVACPGISRGGGGGVEITTVSKWNQVLIATQAEIDRGTRNMSWNIETRIIMNAEELDSPIRVHTNQTTVISHDGKHIQEDDNFWQLLEVTEDGERIFRHILRNGESGHLFAPKADISLATMFPFDYMEFQRGRHILNLDRYFSSTRGNHWTEEQIAFNPFPNGMQRRDRLAFEITVHEFTILNPDYSNTNSEESEENIPKYIQEFLITNIFVSIYNHSYSETFEQRITFNWNSTLEVIIPNIAG